MIYVFTDFRDLLACFEEATINFTTQRYDMAVWKILIDREKIEDLRYVSSRNFASEVGFKKLMSVSPLTMKPQALKYGIYLLFDFEEKVIYRIVVGSRIRYNSGKMADRVDAKKKFGRKGRMYK